MGHAPSATLTYNGAVLGRRDKMKEPKRFPVGVERGAGGYSSAWCYDLPGCYALVPLNANVEERMRIAILEFLSWSHNRASEHLLVDANQVEIAQVVDTGVNVAAGESHAFFLDDSGAVGQSEFPGWANPHDLALDQLRELALALPEGMRELPFARGGSTILGTVAHCAETEALYANQLRPGIFSAFRDPGPIRRLQEAHLMLQQVVCDVPPDLRIRRDSPSDHAFEEWSVRKVMRRSIWHLRYHTWEVREAVSRIWLPG